MEGKDKIILWLAHDEIGNMMEYMESLKKDEIPPYSRIALWGLAFTKTWYRRIERPQFAIYNTLVKCTKSLPCPECYRKKQQKREAKKIKEEEKKEGLKGVLNTFEEAIENKKEKESSESESEPETECESILSTDEIEAIITHLDCDFEKEERGGKTEDERAYTIRIVMNALKESYEYNLLMGHERIHQKNMDKIFQLLVGAFSYFTAYHIDKIFKVIFFIASNLNGVFTSKKGLDMTKKEFDRFLLFVQNTAALSKNKFMTLIDVMSCLNQQALTSFIYDIVKGSISVSSIHKDLFEKYAKPSVNEIEQYKKDHPFSLLTRFTPRVIVLHQEENQSVDELKRANSYLKENIETLMNDLKYSNGSGFIAELKAELEEKEEKIKTLQSK